MKHLFSGLLLINLIMSPAQATASEIVLAIQPIMPQKQTQQAYQPLADYLHKVTGQKVKLLTSANFIAYWELMKRHDWDLVFDAAHFTDYRNGKHGYHVLAKLPDTVSYTLAAHVDEMIIDPNELIGKRVASLPSPGLGAVRLQEIFPNPIRQPEIIQAEDADDAARKVLNGDAVAAIIPTRMLGQYPDLVPIVTTQHVPAPALSASPKVSRALQDQIQNAVVRAGETEQGKAMLKAINLPPFEKANNRVYAGQKKLLANSWGY